MLVCYISRDEVVSATCLSCYAAFVTVQGDVSVNDLLLLGPDEVY